MCGEKDSTRHHELKAFMSICLYMGVKKLPNMALYGASSELVFWSPIISKFMDSDRQLGVCRCLCLIQSKHGLIDCKSTQYDKTY